MMREIEFLGKLLGEVDKPFLAIIGGAKVSDKIAVLENLLERVNAFLIGGAMANTFLKATGRPVGKSKVEEEKLAVARAFLRKAEIAKVDVLLPTDFVVAPSFDSPTGTEVSEIGSDQMALDIGKKTAQAYAARIEKARTVLWNGPMGVFEKPQFAQGTIAVAKALANCRGLTVVGGGDSVAAINEAKVAEKITHISTGGGASLEFLEGETLPGIAVLDCRPEP
jgi:phosphoglycerate kinase